MHTLAKRRLFPLVMLLLFSMITPAHAQSPMTYIGTTVSQNTDDAFLGQTNARILSFNIKTQNSNNPLKLDRIYLTGLGTTDTGDIIKVRLYYTGSNNYSGKVFDNAIDTVGEIVGPGPAFSFRMNDALLEGDNYYYLVYDVSQNAKLGNLLDAMLDSFELQGNFYNLSANPPGNREIEFFASYCPIIITTPNSVNNKFAGITHVDINGTENISSDADALTTYPLKKVTVHRQENITLKIKVGQGYTEQVGGWVDWNNDGVFDSTEEVFYLDSALPATEAVVSFNVPCHAIEGTHAFRIMSDDTSASRIQPCNDLTYGDAEEYYLVVKEEQLKASFKTEQNIYAGSPVVMSNTSKAWGNIQFQWDYNNDGVYDYTGLNGKHTYSSTGWKKVHLKANYIECDTSYSLIYSDSFRIVNALLRPESNFITTQNQFDTMVPVELMDISMYHPSKWHWKISPEKYFYQNNYEYINGTDSTSQNPVVRFLRPGKYSISLQAENAAGMGTIAFKKDYITIGTGFSMCSGADTLFNMSGFVFDDGGANTPYENAQQCSIIIKPGCAKEIKLSFSKFDISSRNKSSSSSKGGDYIRIYDGTGPNGVPLHTSAGTFGFQNQYPGNIAVAPPDLVATSGAVYIEWETDASFIGDGFELFWSAVNDDTTKPSVSINAAAKAFLNEKVTYTASSAKTDLSYLWDLNNDEIVDDSTHSAEYTFYTPGNHTVTLYTKTCRGIDTFHHSIEIIAPQAAPLIDFTASATQVSTGDHIQFTDLSKNDPIGWKWIISHSNPNAGFRFINSTELSQNPIVLFNETGIYTIELQATNAKGTNWLRKTHYITVYDHCKPNVYFPSDDAGITSVIITDNRGYAVLSNQSGSGPSVKSGYTHFPDPTPATLYVGATYHYRISRKTSHNNLSGKLYIDYNRNGDFNQVGELIFTDPKVMDTVWTGSFTVPPGINKGITRMRIGVNYTGQLMYACNNNLYGEWEDYTIGISSDTVKPVIELIGNDTVVIEEYRNYYDSGVTAYDNVKGDISSKVIIKGFVNTNEADTYLVTFGIVDSVGNEALEKTRVVIVIPDTTKPEINIIGNESMYVEAMQKYVESGAQIKDNSGVITDTDTIGAVNTMQIGKYPIHYYAEDQRGNTALSTRMVEVGDTTPPDFVLFAPYTVEQQVYEKFEEPGFQQPYDDYWKLNVKLDITDYPDIFKLGTYLVKYTATDGSGNERIHYRTVKVIDKIAPTLEMAPDTIQITMHQLYIHPTPKMYDNYYDISELKLIPSEQFVPTWKLGFIPVTYYVIDPSQNKSESVTIIVEIVDNTRPTIVLVGPPSMQTKQWKFFDDPGVQVQDNDRQRPEIIMGGTFTGTDTPGYFTRTYFARDASGNVSDTVSRLIYVEPSSGVEENSFAGSKFNYYPNPAKDKLNLKFENPEEAQVQIQLFDLQGKLISVLTSHNSGTADFSIDVSGISAGYYVLRILSGDHSGNYPLIIQR